MQKIKRCRWCNEHNPLYLEYHDKEWSALNLDERYLFEMLVLEMFQAGLSWECILNKRADFKMAFDNFDVYKVADYDEIKVLELMNNEKLVRNNLKIKAAINNAQKFIEVSNEYGGFKNYLLTYFPEVLIEYDKVESSLSIKIAKDLKRRGFKFVGSKIIYSYLQAIGLINGHEQDCFLAKK